MGGQIGRCAGRRVITIGVAERAVCVSVCMRVCTWLGMLISWGDWNCKNLHRTATAVSILKPNRFVVKTLSKLFNTSPNST